MLSVVALVVSCMSCGSDGDDGNGGAGDAGNSDASGGSDASPDAGDTGFLGQSCQQPTCPGTSQCLSQVTGGPGYCTAPCAENNVLTPPSASDPTCVPFYSGTIGTPVCGMPTSNPDAPPMFRWFCVLDCSADDMCPSNLSCQDYTGGSSIVLGRYCLP